MLMQGLSAMGQGINGAADGVLQDYRDKLGMQYALRAMGVGGPGGPPTPGGTAAPVGPAAMMSPNGPQGSNVGIDDAIDQTQQQLKQQKAYRMMATDGLGMDPDAVSRMSLNELRGRFQGMAMAAGQREAAARLMKDAAETQMYLGHNDYFKQRGQLEAAEAAQRLMAMKNMDKYNALVSNATRPNAAATMVDLMATRNPSDGANPLAMARMMNTAATSPTVSPRLTPAQVQAFMGQANLSPDQMKGIGDAYKMMGGMGVNGKQPPNYMPQLYDLGSGHTGVVETTGKVFPDKPNTPVKAPPSPVLTPAIDGATGQVIPGMYLDGSGKVHTRSGENSALATLTGNSNTVPGLPPAPAIVSAKAGTPAAGQIPVIKDAKDIKALKPGSLYKTPDGKLYRRGEAKQ